MRIEGSGPTSGTSSAKKTKKADKAKSGKANFNSHISASGKPNSTESQGVESVSSIDSLFMLQEVGDDSLTHDKSVLQGFDILSYLEDIKLSLLSGKISRSLLHDLDLRLKKWKKDYNDPKLMQIIKEIELRAKIELEKIKKHDK